MRRKYTKNNKVEDEVDAILAIIFLLVLAGYFGRNFLKHYILYIAAGICFIIFLSIYFFRKKNAKEAANLQEILQQISDKKIRLIDMVNQFGKAPRNVKNTWTYYGYSFDRKDLENLREELVKTHNLNISVNDNLEESTEKNSEFLKILKKIIDDDKKKYAHNVVVSKETHDLSVLSKSGDDFENLIVRLYNAMGYTAKRIGGHGDQGGDVIATLNGESLLIQAKYYSGNVDNKAVQQAYTAKEIYKCDKSAVIIASEFTAGAREAATKTGVLLIDRKQVQQELSKYLNENWV